jgi:hypothetical protein
MHIYMYIYMYIVVQVTTYSTILQVREWEGERARVAWQIEASATADCAAATAHYINYYAAGAGVGG